jgi:hypothetical protein
MEAAAEGEVAPDARVSIDDVERRSRLATSLRPSVFPGERDALVAVAREQFAEEEVLRWLESLPEATVFRNVEEVWEALGGRRESRDSSGLAPQPRRAPRPAPAEAAAARQSRPRRERPAAPADAGAPVRQEVAPPPSLRGRLCGVALATVEVAVGLAIEAVRQVRRRL